MADRDRVEVLYVAAAPRSGTTLLSALLGELQGTFNAGEIRFIWKQVAVDGTCGCTRHLDECRVWSRVLPPQVRHVSTTLAQLVQGGAAHSLIRTLPATMARRRVFGTTATPVRLHLERTLPLYRKTAEAVGCRLVVDSSKSPSYAYLLACSSELSVHLLHVVRDPRAVVYSWLRERGDTSRQAQRLRAVLYHAFKWAAWNIWTEALVSRRAASYTRIVYENFVLEPRKHLAAIAASRGLSSERLPIDAQDQRRSTLRPNHTVDGNGYRFRVGEVPIRHDDEWRHHMRRHERLMVTAFTWPLLRRYGFGRHGLADSRPVAATDTNEARIA